MDFVKFIEQRKALHFSQVKICEGICTQSTLSKFESGGHVPSIRILSKLCTRIGLTIDDLNQSNKISTNQLKVRLDALEQELVLADYSGVVKGLSQIDEAQLNSKLLKMQFYYLRGMLSVLINQPPQEALYDFALILNDLDEPHKTIFTQLVYVGSGVMYNRLNHTDRANLYFKKVHRFIQMVSKNEKLYLEQVGDDYLRLLTLIFFTANYYNLVGQLELSERLVAQGVEMCTERHVTYFLPRLKFLAAKNAIEEKRDEDVIERLINEVLAFARVDENSVLEVKVAALNARYQKGQSLVNLLP